MDNISLRDLKKHLTTVPFDEMVADIITLYKDIPAVREYYLIKLCPAAEITLLEKYKKIIENEFFPNRGFGKARASVVRKAISDFKKIAKSPYNIVDLLFFHVSIGVDFTNSYGDIDDVFYASLGNSFEQALKYGFKHGIADEIRKSAKIVLEKCQGFGWGFSDVIDDIYYTYYDSYEEDND
ncbi:MAG: DUF6155 family protein [Veillonellales bacterium]